MIVVFVVMITVMIVPAVGIAVGRCQRAALQPPGKKEQSDGEQAAVARATAPKSSPAGIVTSGKKTLPRRALSTC
jgi:hypothetical protein